MEDRNDLKRAEYDYVVVKNSICYGICIENVVATRVINQLLLRNERYVLGVGRGKIFTRLTLFWSRSCKGKLYGFDLIINAQKMSCSVYGHKGIANVYCLFVWREVARGALKNNFLFFFSMYFVSTTLCSKLQYLKVFPILY